MLDDLDPDLSDDLNTIKERIREATTWFNAVGNDPATGFPRTTALAPHPFETKRVHVVRGVADSRRYEIGKLAEPDAKPCGGRLLRYNPNETVLDGTSETSSKGFFDVYDAPPWDLWVGWLNPKNRSGLVICWVPEPLIPAAQAGIDVNPMDCINWLESLEKAVGIR